MSTEEFLLSLCGKEVTVVDRYIKANAILIAERNSPGDKPLFKAHEQGREHRVDFSFHAESVDSIRLEGTSSGEVGWYKIILEDER